MIIGGLQTGNTRWLAAHLQNAADNEGIELAEVTGTIADDIDGALTEFDAIASGTRAKEGVYAAFINPPEPLTRDQYMQAIAHIARALGLAGQPRLIVFHVKNGREHCHIVWSRIAVDRMKAIHLSHDRQKLRRCARELAALFGLELPPNLANDRGKVRFDEPPQPSRAEKAMEAASGLSRDGRRAVVTACYRNSDSAQSFASALEAAGYMLARGDRRAYVVVDIAGDVHSLARQIDGARTSDVKNKLEGLPLSRLPPVARAKALMLQRAAARRDALRAHDQKRTQAKAERERLAAVQRKRRAALDLAWQQMKIRHMHERKVLLAHIEAERARRHLRRHWRAFGLVLYLRKIAVIRQLLEYYDKRRKRTQQEQHRALLDGLRRRHENEARALRRRYRALQRLMRRESITFGLRFGTVDETDTDQLTPPPLDVVVTWQPLHGRIDPGWAASQPIGAPLQIPVENTLIGFAGGIRDLTGDSPGPPGAEISPQIAILTGQAAAHIDPNDTLRQTFNQHAVQVSAANVSVSFDDGIGAPPGDLYERAGVAAFQSPGGAA